MTVAFWAELDDASLSHGAFFTNDFSETCHSGIFINFSSNQRLSISFGNGEGFSSSHRLTKHSNQFIESGKWYHFTAVFLNANDLRIYINGEEDFGFYEGEAENLSYIGQHGNIGRKDFSPEFSPFYYMGSMDDLMFWNRGLTHPEITILYEQATASIEDHMPDIRIDVYPNPVREKLYFENANMTEQQFFISDAAGIEVAQGKCDQEIDVTNLNSGIYILRLSDSREGTSLFGKFIKQ